MFVNAYGKGNSNYDVFDSLSSGKLRVNTFQWESDVDWYEFEVSSTGTYAIYSSGRADLYGALYTDNILVASDDDNGIDYNFYMSVSLTAGKLYKLRVSTLEEECEADEYNICIY